MSDLKQLHRIIEGALFASNEPLSVERIVALFANEAERPDKKEIRQALQDLIENYAEHGVELKELASGYQFQVKADLAKWIKRLWEERPPRYSRALLETLVLVAYRQPITRGEIEEVRGVTVSTSIMKTLLEREWVKVVGHRDVPGKPGLYATTKAFLDYFGLKSLEDLPPLAEVRDLDKAGEKLQEQLDAAVENVIAEENLIAANAVQDDVVEDVINNAASDEMIADETQDDVDVLTDDLLNMYSEAEESFGQASEDIIE
ncbi:MAG: SMC-Scp complex subunit ScpB [Gammaproteobacteria bacterium]|jgi:segregation and condensation protein B